MSRHPHFASLPLTGLVLLLIVVWCTVCVGVQGRRVVAVGDLHGDYNQSRAVLRLTRLIDQRDHWIGEDAYLVQLGDILDVGPDDIKIVRLLMKLQKQARMKGGDVIELLGNHELRNFRGDYTAVDPDSLAASGGVEGRNVLLSNATEVGMYLRTRNAIYHYGPFLFMHGGFSTATSNMITSLKKVDEFNNELRNALVNGTVSPLASGGLNLNEEDIDDVANPILVRSILNVKCDDLHTVLDKKFVGIQSVVVGHVPHDPRDFDDWRLCGGRLVDIDFGMSRWKKGDPGHVAALEIDDLAWHMQLIEATVAFSENTPIEDTRTTPYSKHPFVRLLLFVVLVLFAIGGVAYLLYRHESRKSGGEDEPLINEADPTTQYTQLP